MNSISRGLHIIFVIAIIISLAGAGAVRTAAARTAPYDVTITVTTLDDEYLIDGYAACAKRCTLPTSTWLGTAAQPATASAWTRSSLQ